MRSVLIASLVMLGVTDTVVGQQTADARAIEVVVARYAITRFTTGLVAFDTTNALFSEARWRPVRRTPERINQLKDALNGAKIGALSDFRICQTDNLNTCELRGVEAVLSISVPETKGDEAVVAVRIFQSYRLVGSGRSLIGSRYERLLLEKGRNGWIVSKVLPGGSIS